MTVQKIVIDPDTNRIVTIVADEQYPEPHAGFQQTIVLNLIQALDEDGNDLNLTEDQMQSLIDQSDSDWVKADY